MPKSARENQLAFGLPLGYIEVPTDVVTAADRSANLFWSRQVETDYTDQVDTEKPVLPLDWLPEAQLEQLGFRLVKDCHHWVMTTGVDPHIDNAWGLNLVWVLRNDGFYFKQGRVKHTHAVGEWFVFDDSVTHSADLKKPQKSPAVFLGWAVKLVPA